MLERLGVSGRGEGFTPWGDPVWYAEAVRGTAFYPDAYVEGQFDAVAQYILVAMLGELGELSELVKKVSRDDGGRWCDAKRELAAKEIGDVMWYRCEYMRRIEGRADGYDAFQWRRLWAEGGGERLAPRSLGEALIRAFRSTQAASSICVDLPEELAFIAKSLGFTMEEVLDRNVEKLMSRMIRSRLRGSGDER